MVRLMTLAGDFSACRGGRWPGFGVSLPNLPPRQSAPQTFLILRRFSRFAIHKPHPLPSPPCPAPTGSCLCINAKGQDKSRIKVCVNLERDCNTPERVGGRRAKYKTNNGESKKYFHHQHMEYVSANYSTAGP